MSFEEKGTLPIGVFHDGKLCTEFVVRPLKIKASLSFQRSEDFEKCKDDDDLTGLALLGRRLEIEGVPPEVQDLSWMEELADEDVGEIMEADGRLKEQIAAFRGKAKKAAHTGPASSENTVGSSEKNGGKSAGGDQVAGGVGGDPGPIAGKGT